MEEFSLSPFLSKSLACPTCHAAPLRPANDSLSCPACGRDFLIRDGLPYLLPEYTNQQIERQASEESNGSMGKTYDQKWMPYGVFWEAAERLTAFDELGLVPGGTLLDLGGGTLRCGLYALEKGAGHACGLDLRPGMLKEGKKKAAERGYGQQVDAVVADARFLPFAEGTFDNVVSLELIEHIPDSVSSVFREVFRVLKPGGRAVVNTWSLMPYLSKRREKERGLVRGTTFYKHYLPGEFHTLFADVDFSTKRMYGQRFVLLHSWAEKLGLPGRFGLAVERTIRRRLPRLSWLLGTCLMARLEK